MLLASSRKKSIDLTRQNVRKVGGRFVSGYKSTSFLADYYPVEENKFTNLDLYERYFYIREVLNDWNFIERINEAERSLDQLENETLGDLAVDIHVYHITLNNLKGEWVLLNDRIQELNTLAQAKPNAEASRVEGTFLDLKASTDLNFYINNLNSIETQIEEFKKLKDQQHKEAEQEIEDINAELTQLEEVWDTIEAIQQKLTLMKESGVPGMTEKVAAVENNELADVISNYNEYTDELESRKEQLNSILN